jgi:hypothetical protein
MTSIREMAGSLWQGVSGLLRNRRDTTPIDSVAKLEEFAGARSAYVAQKTLYGYVKARMGTRYPRMFEDQKLIDSLNIAKHHVFAACLSDMTVYAVGVALHNQPVGNDERHAMARRCYRAALHEIIGAAAEPFPAQDCIDEFERRLAETDWRLGALRPENFTDSPKALFRWAPIADQLKKYDREIVENSVKFSWRDIREQFQTRIDGAAVCADWSRQPADSTNPA